METKRAPASRAARRAPTSRRGWPPRGGRAARRLGLFARRPRRSRDGAVPPARSVEGLRLPAPWPVARSLCGGVRCIARANALPAWARHRICCRLLLADRRSLASPSDIAAEPVRRVSCSVRARGCCLGDAHVRRLLSHDRSRCSRSLIVLFRAGFAELRDRATSVFGRSAALAAGGQPSRTSASAGGDGVHVPLSRRGVGAGCRSEGERPRCSAPPLFARRRGDW